MAKKNPHTKFKRNRSGCLTCRDRHIKCDEKKPICNNCLRSNRKCFRGIRLNFTQYTFLNPLENLTTENKRQLKLNYNLENFRILDHSITVASIYNHKIKYSKYFHLHSPEDLKESDIQFQNDIYFSQLPLPTSSINSSELASQIQIAASREGISSGTHTNEELLIQSSVGSVKSTSQILPTNDPDLGKYDQIFNYMNFLQPNLTNQPHLQISQPKQQQQTIYSQPVLQHQQLHQQYTQNYQGQQQHLLHYDQPYIQQSSSAYSNQLKSHSPLPHQTYQQQQLAANPTLQPPGTLPFALIPQQHQHYHEISNPDQHIPILHHIQPIDQSNNFNYTLNIENLVQKEHYYWFLDLFNGQKIYQNIIPTICLNNSMNNKNLLMLSLMSCSKSSNIDIMALTNLQSYYWDQIKNINFTENEDEEFAKTNLELLQNFLISINLIMFGIYLRFNKFSINNFLKSILQTQSILFEKVLGKVENYVNYSASFNLLSNVFITIVQSITILKFFISKSFDFSYEFKQQKLRGSSRQQQNIYEQVDTSSFISLNKHEIALLDQSYYETTTITPTETQKLKKLIWHLITIDYIITNPLDQLNINSIFTNLNSFIIDESTPDLENLQSPLRIHPNVIVRTILQNFLIKLINMNQSNNLQLLQNLNLKLQFFFQNLNHLFGDNNDIMIFYWHKFFEWTERYISS
ncbi:hypothetical protein KGF54_003641 [Candida jiufengensis]|uniref:uncharacterized protein n=1 Tax=Candida jiufengensis TaxID=497108 RepID=UPI002224D5CE|nr:uncharacterized protein KGF54_003641 [Candida jiufengensis]KAI5952774.1 hypothetical protein KGF54_003641 [Candida jiufengensis]